MLSQLDPNPLSVDDCVTQRVSAGRQNGQLSGFMQARQTGAFKTELSSQKSIKARSPGLDQLDGKLGRSCRLRLAACNLPLNSRLWTILRMDAIALQ